MMAVSPSARPTLALVYQDETLMRRNNIRQKLTGRGFVIKKEYVSDSKRFDFSTVDLVVAISDNIARSSATAISSAAERDGVEVFFLPHQVGKPGWERLNARAPLAVVPESEPAVGSDLDADTAQLFTIIEQERDQARAHGQKLAGELGNARADRERLTKEAAELKGKVLKLETELEAARLDTGETQEQRNAWGDRLRTLEAERDAAIAQNRKLVKELEAARERLERTDDAEITADALRTQLEAAKQERKEYCDRYKMAAAREGKALEKIKQLEARGEPKVIKDLRTELTSTTQALTEAHAAIAMLKKKATEAERRASAAERAEVYRPGGKGSGKDVSQVAEALRGVVKLGVMSADEAFDKLVEAAK